MHLVSMPSSTADKRCGILDWFLVIYLIPRDVYADRSPWASENPIPVFEGFSGRYKQEPRVERGARGLVSEAGDPSTAGQITKPPDEGTVRKCRCPAGPVTKPWCVPCWERTGKRGLRSNQAIRKGSLERRAPQRRQSPEQARQRAPSIRARRRRTRTCDQATGDGQ